jgi:hypothetical protein
MSTISFQCYSCHQVLKVGLDKAGKRGKCPKCGTLLTIPVSSTVGDLPPVPAAQAPPPLPAAPAQPPYPAAPAQPPYPQAPAQPPYPAAPMQYAPAPVPAGPLRAEPVDDDFGAPPPRYAPAEDAYLAEEEVPRRGGGFGEWARARLGLLLVFIGSCVLAGAFVLELIGYLIMTINLIQELSGRPTQGFGSTAFRILIRLGVSVGLAGSATALVGYVFCILGPKQRGTLPLAITTLALASLHLLLALIFQLPSLFGASMFGGGEMAVFGHWFVLLLTQLFFGAQLIMFPFYMRALCSIRKRWGAAGACLAPAIMAMAYTALRLLGWIMLYVAVQAIASAARQGPASNPSKAWAWVNIILLWIGSIVFAIFIILYILAVWRVRRAVSR